MKVEFVDLMLFLTVILLSICINVIAFIYDSTWIDRAITYDISVCLGIIGYYIGKRYKGSNAKNER